MRYIFIRKELKKKDLNQFLLLRIELPGNITKLKVQATSSKEKINGIKIFAYKKKDDIAEASKKDFHEIFDKREYNEIRDVIPLNSDILLTDYGAIDETERRREIQIAHNKKYGIIPQTIKKPIENNLLSLVESYRSLEDIVAEEMVDMGIDYFSYNLTDRLINYKVGLNPGEYFLYSNLNTQILGLLIEKLSGQKLNEFIYENIYKYIGREKAIWSTDRCGNIKAFCCLFLKNEDFLRFGKLVLDKGRIGDKVIISEQYINMVFTPDYKLIDIREGGDKNYFYGLQGWTINTHDGHKIKFFWGIQGQFNLFA